MSRSKYKGYYYQYDLLAYLKKKKNNSIKNKSLIILPHYENQFIKVSNGRSTVTLKINKNMIGYKFGEFIYTRKKFIYKKK